MKNLSVLLSLLSITITAAIGQAYMPILPEKAHIAPRQELLPEVGKERVLKHLADRGVSGNNVPFAINTSETPLSNLEKGYAYQHWPEFENLLESASRDLIRNYDDETMEFTVQIIRSSAVNASATAGGYMYFNVGLLAEVSNYEELILVLAHEMGHNLSNHLLQQAIDKEKTDNKLQTAGFLLNGLAYQVARVVTINNYLANSREDEREADVFAMNALNKMNCSLEQASEIYALFARLEKNAKLKYGNGPLFSFYGSTHPEPAERGQLLKSNSKLVESNIGPASFHTLRNKARYEKLSLLIGEGSYRQAIEDSWRYLMQEPNNDTIVQFMFDASRRLRLFQNEEAANSMALFYKYYASDEVKTSAKSNQLLLPGAYKDYIETLLMINTDGLQTPFPFGVTFKELYELLREKVINQKSTEGDFLIELASRSINETALNKYIEQGGIYSNYANLLLNRDDIVMNKALFVPNQVFLQNQAHLNYYQRLRGINWFQGGKFLKEKGFDVTVKRRDIKEDMTPYEQYAFTRLESVLYHLEDASQNKDFDMVLFDPLAGEYMLENHIGEFFSFSIRHPDVFLLTDFSLIDVRSGTPKIYFATGKGIGDVVAYDYVYKQMKKRYKEIKYP